MVVVSHRLRMQLMLWWLRMRLVHRRHWIGAARAFLRSFLVVVTVTVVQPWWLIAEFHCLEDKGVVVELEWSAVEIEMDELHVF